MNINQLEQKTSKEVVAAKLGQKHPAAYSISTKEDTHCVLGHTVYGWVETEDEKLFYSTDKAGRLRLVSRDTLTPTYKSVRLEPKDSVVRVAGDGPYAGKYILNETVDGWYNTTENISEASPMRRYYADIARNNIARNAQYCYGGKFEVVTIPTN